MPKKEIDKLIEKVYGDKQQYFNPLYSKDVMKWLTESVYPEYAIAYQSLPSFWSRLLFWKVRPTPIILRRKANGIWDVMPKYCFHCKLSPCICRYFEGTKEEWIIDKKIRNIFEEIEE